MAAAIAAFTSSGPMRQRRWLPFGLSTFASIFPGFPYKLLYKQKQGYLVEASVSWRVRASFSSKNLQYLTD
ncbi:hypothetical protein IVB38_28225 [Bradyrhizobium sp. 38]|uniref:hypothetical protein n=1 Tax=unclassified Bradyrhizobium TaxID=2631580 RepID=UPI001FFBD1CA|nr:MULTISPECIES: hypothetical protein [unclassified Bradyrhizobium]MCK1339783.1 hypothetical protein [Bradyrhizobium sp. 38]MCK1782714.1 hypothetical protein [Bradyrhizobium sp. 132]